MSQIVSVLQGKSDAMTPGAGVHVQKQRGDSWGKHSLDVACYNSAEFPNESLGNRFASESSDTVG